ncbi:MAG: peroxiredoxin family protein [Phycisphaerae bacterium]
MRRALQTPLRTADGTPLCLADDLGKRPLLIVFYRGHWCPYCKRYLCKLRDHHARLTAGGTRLVAVSPEHPAAGQRLVRTLELPFTLLADVNGVLIDAFGLRNRIGAAHAMLPHPGVIFFDAAGNLHHRSIDRDYKRRTTIRSLLHLLNDAGMPVELPAEPMPD